MERKKFEKSSSVIMGKLCVALAILKKKPAHLSAYEYTERLASRQMKRMLELEEKCQRLEKVQQDVQLQCMATAGGSGDATTTYDFPTPSCSSKPLEKHTMLHSNFLQCSYHLKTSVALLEEPKLSDQVNQLALIKNIEYTLRFLLNDPTKINEPIVMESLSNVIAVAKKVVPNTSFANQLDFICRQFFETLVKDILLNEDIQSVQKYKYIHVTSQFVHSPALQETLFDTLLEFASQFLGYLQQRCVGLQRHLDPVYFENNYYIMFCLLECLTRAAQHPKDQRDWFLLREKIRDNLEKYLSLVVDKFPAFFHSVWKIIALADKVILEQDPKPSPGEVHWA